MSQLLTVVLFVVGAVLARCAWASLRLQVRHAKEQARAESEAQRAALAERLGARDASLADLKLALAQSQTQIGELQAAVSNLRQEKVQLGTTLEKERSQSAEKLALLAEAEQKLANAFKALAAEALSTNNQSFLNLAKSTLETYQETAKSDLEKRQVAIDSLVAPVKLSLEKVDAKIQALETARAGAYGELSEQVKSLVVTEKQLRTETANLVKALRTPNVRGRWGEIQLRRVVEMAGMLDHCDFEEQVSTDTEEGRLRPDMVVRLPGGINIVVDAKTPLAAYLEAVEATDDETRQQKMKDHARQVQTHIAALSKKAYWDQFQPSPDFVILFLPGETFYDAAREHDPALIESAVNQRVMIATPMSLITLLRAVAIGWRQESLARNAQEISDLGKALYKRLSTLGEHFLKLGRNLDSAVSSYNQTVGTLESGVLTSARKFRDLGAVGGAEELVEVTPLEQVTRKLQKVELLPEAEAAAAELARQEGAATAAEHVDR